MTFADLHDLCGSIRRYFPNAIIGGGACRDLFLGGPIKDIDVFVQADTAEFNKGCDNVALLLSGIITGSASYVHAPSIDIQVPGLPPLNMVQRDCSPLLDIGDYDFGISQIGVSDTEVFKTAAFMKDVADNTVTYMHAGKDKPAWHRLSSANRLGRILAKHPSLLPMKCAVLGITDVEMCPS